MRPLSLFWVRQQTPFGANVLCLGASGEDGMPVVLSHTVNPDSLQAEDFSVVRVRSHQHAYVCHPAPSRRHG